jgi:hypothetical protein
MAWSSGSAVLGLSVFVYGTARAQTAGDDYWTLFLLGMGGFFVLMSVLTGTELMRARAAMRASPWQRCEFKMFTRTPGPSWPWVVRFLNPIDTPPALIKEGWRVRARQARELLSGEGWVVVADHDAVVIAPGGFAFLLTVRGAKNPAEAGKWEDSFRYPADSP